ncbi:NEDD4-like E3 ubiquitin-protein ligase WWP2 [Pezoporus flaviventris]|uniref:NEDD4-like E3 ubiquitin-protein ligase WWP2 n=1 Tax=Pezoporus flaviventris TaxID=889875 RepID=UPI002AB2ADD8|nr:NEDD4-like E3 ubiquitin-protein ligase WWP2 [Pezoporus flaviventris]
MENKGSVVSGGELMIFLDEPAADLGSLPNASSVTEDECCPSPHACGSSVHKVVSSSRERSGSESTPGTPEQESQCQQPPSLPGHTNMCLECPGRTQGVESKVLEPGASTGSRARARRLLAWPTAQWEEQPS